MMDAKAIVQFTDRITRKFYLPGDSYTGTEERVTELVGKGFLKVEEIKIAVKPKKSKK
jgi:hypothetical protein